MRRGRVYLAGPIAGLSYDGAVDWREHARLHFAEVNIDAYSPMRHKEALRHVTVLDAEAYSDPLCSPRGLTTRDRHDVTRCDVMIANLLGAARVSTGTMIEFGWADAHRKPIIAVMEARGNLHEHPMVQELAGYRVTTLADAYAIACSLLIP